jgi:hypothetical protein
VSSDAVYAHEARLNRLDKREYLHLRVSKLVDYCRNAHRALGSGNGGGGGGGKGYGEGDGSDDALEEVNRTLTQLLMTSVAMARRLTFADRGSLFIVVSPSSSSSSRRHQKKEQPYLWSKVAESEGGLGSVSIRVPLGEGSLAGSVAATGDACSVADVSI